MLCMRKRWETLHRITALERQGSWWVRFLRVVPVEAGRPVIVLVVDWEVSERHVAVGKVDICVVC